MSGEAENTVDYVATNGKEIIPITRPPLATGTRGLVAKLCEAGAAIGWIEKSGRNAFHNYAYATEADLVAALRGELYKRGIFVFPTVLSQERKAITVNSKNGQRETALTDVMIRWTFTDGETGEKFECDVPGCGEDSGDKGIYKAMTGSEKYLLMKAFLIPTGDDPEKDTEPEKKEAWQAGKDAQQAVVDRKLGVTGHQTSAARHGASLSVCLLDWPKTHEFRVYGGGTGTLISLLEEKKPEVKKLMRYDEAEYFHYVKDSGALALQQFCEANNLTCEFVESATGEVKANATPAPQESLKTPPKAQGDPIRKASLTEDRLTGTLEAALLKRTAKKMPFLAVTVGEHKASLFDNAEVDLGGKKVQAFDLLQDSLDKEVEFAVKANGQYLNITGILKVGVYEW